MKKTDSHVHNHFSPDSQARTREIVLRAIENGMNELCITNHAEWYDPKTGKSSFDPTEATRRFNLIRQEITGLQPEFPTIYIGFGVELEYAEDRLADLGPWIDSMDFDLVLGSVHVVSEIAISSHKFADQLFKKTDEKTAYEAYYSEMKKMVDWGHFDVVAHFDIHKKYGHEYYGAFDPEKYRDLIVPILGKMAAKGIGMEINTKCVQDKCREIFPHPTILKWAVEAGIRNFTLGSDSHQASEVGRFNDEAVALARSAGILNLSSYRQRIPS